jgi:hypothetical protein
VKHIRFWTLLGNTLQYTEGKFGKFEAQTLLCIGSIQSTATTEPEVFDDEESVCFTGAINGDLIVWKKFKAEKIIQGIHQVNRLTDARGREIDECFVPACFSRPSILLIPVLMGFSLVAKMVLSKDGHEISLQPGKSFKFHLCSMKAKVKL